MRQARVARNVRAPCTCRLKENREGGACSLRIQFKVEWNLRLLGGEVIGGAGQERHAANGF